jgi:RNase P subunit RPR2
MVKIVGIDNAVVQRITCRNCASILEYTGSEVKLRIKNDYDGAKIVIKSICCPGCNHEVNIKSYNILLFGKR